MKKIISLLIVSLTTIFSFSQSQRIVLVEEFTSGTCPPSGIRDPILDTLLAHNTSKAVSIVYQGPPIPSADPMYNHNPADVNIRASYYSVSYVPKGFVDGMLPGPTTPSVVDITQALIDSVYAIPSPFTILVGSAFNSSADSMIINITVTCTQNVSITQPKLHVAIVENIVHFAAPIPGSGLQDFYTVMRKMAPNANGTLLTGTWTVGQTQTFQFKVRTDPSIYSLSQLAVVAFIQDQPSKVVYQAGYAPSLPPLVDAGIISVDSISLTGCGNTILPVVTIKNFGLDTLTSCQLYYSIDGLSPQVYNWTGSLATNALDTIALPALTITGTVAHIFKAYTSAPNSFADFNNLNNSRELHFLMSIGSGSIAITEDFQPVTFPPSGWSIQNPGSSQTWGRYNGAGGFGTSSASVRLLFYSMNMNETDYLYLPPIDLSSAVTPLEFSFDVAYRQYINEQDSLNVQVSVDCGISWSTFYAKAGTTLATVSPSTSFFIPSASNWRHETISFDSLVGQPDVLIRFEGISRIGNNLYIDNVNIDADNAVMIPELSAPNDFNIFPNPTSGLFSIADDNNEIEYIAIYNSIGKLVYKGSSRQMNLQGSPGVYSIRITDKEKNVINKKLIIQ
jgi:hypothetical protein